MSQDLFAAFGSLESVDPVDPRKNGYQTEPSAPTLGGGTHTGATGIAVQLDQVAAGRDDEEEEDFGDFEDASASEAVAPTVVDKALVKVPTAKPTVPPQRSDEARTAAPKPPERSAATGRHPFADHMDFLFAADDDDEYNAGADDLGDLHNNPEAAVAYSKRVIAQQEEEQRRKANPPSVPPQISVPAKQEPRLPKKLQKKSGYAPAKATNVLFDAENVSEEDDGLGDFEGDAIAGDANTTAHVGTNGAIESSALPAMDLLGLDELPARLTPSEEYTAHLPIRQGDRSMPRTDQLHAGHQRPTSVAEDDVWDDFEDSAATRSGPFVSATSTVDALTVSSTHLPSVESAGAAKSADQLPPTNIPPPAILLSIFPAILASGEEALFNPLAKLDFKQRQTLLAHPATAMFLKGYLNLSIVLGHIIAGRKLRWKRDQYLAQGMRIGPATTGGGMKLTGIDKTEVVKEEREVLEAVRTWKAQVGKLRGAVTTASSTPGVAKLPPVPEIAETMPVRSLKPAEGGVTATHACALCGLKREERVAKVDVAVEDSFGEWWIQGMSMHLVCLEFWETHRQKLKSR